MAKSAFEELDEKPLSRFHVLAMITTGMGVFTDGYDLSSIGVVLPLVLASFGIHHISGLQSGLLAASALVGSAVGALVFGFLAQHGRKKFYGIDVGVMAAAAAAQAFAPNLWMLIAIRFVLGIGVGADYVLSPTIMAEHSNRKDRGKKLGLGFSMMWGLGAMASALVLMVLQGLHVSPGLQWRIVLGFGAVPALSVFTLRREMPETARFLARVEGDSAAARDVIQGITGAATAPAPVADRRPIRELLARHASAVLGAAVLWMVYDIVMYPSNLFGPSVFAHAIGFTAVGFTLVTNAVFYTPGTLLGCALIDRIGRKRLMAIGYVMSAIALFAFAANLSRADSWLGFFLLGGYLFAISIGPGAVSGSGLLGVELAATRVRSVAQAITVVGGRLGGAFAAIAFPVLLKRHSEAWLMDVLAGASIVGAVLSMTLVPETANRSLEEINDDTDEAIAGLAPSVAAP